MSIANQNFLTHLNPAQKEGVINVEGPCMIIAGAGSGKTRVLTYRIAYLLSHKKVDPFNIIALTFTNKASKEMKYRIGQLVAGEESKNLWMGTFHSVFNRILRAEGHRLGYLSHFGIYDADDSKSLIKRIVKELNLDDKIYKPNVVFNRISGAKNRLISWQDYVDNPLYQEDDVKHRKPEMGRIYKIYAQRCFAAGVMDFDDLLFNTNFLFQQFPDVLHKYQHRFKYLLIDEFQDTNISQYFIVKRLAAVHQNICVVGDDAQSIYAFRGAEIENILSFKRDYPDTIKIKLEQNYRSTQTIVKAANSLINKNTNQIKKEIWTSNESGELIALIQAINDNEESKLVASSIFENKMKSHASNNEFAILYRTNSQSRSMEESLRKNNIKYRVVGGLSFYQRKEIKDLLAYFRYVINPNDETSMRRIINLPKRGIGITTIDKIMIASQKNNKTLEEILENASLYLEKRKVSQLEKFLTFIKASRLIMQKKDAYETALHIAKNSGMLKELYEENTVESRSRYDNTQELLNAIKEFVDDPEREDKGLGTFLQEISLLTDEDRKEKTDDAITLMTIHMAKGLEFNYVYVVGLEEDLFPSQMMMSSRAELEEERRLFYVAITRAKKKLYFTYALNRYRYGKMKTCDPSRFLTEVDPNYIKTNKRNFSSPYNESSKYTPITKNFVNDIQQDRKVQSLPTPTHHQPSTDFQPSDISNLVKGMKVEHPKFGYGIIEVLEYQGSYKKAKVNFEKAGEKTLLLTFAKLRICED